MIRREFLKNAAALASGLAAKIGYGAPCSPLLDGAENEACDPPPPPPPPGESNLGRRTRELTSANTPQLGVNYFMSETGSPQVANNRTSPQHLYISYSSINTYYDPIRRVMHQLDKEHASQYLEHAVYDEVANSWSTVPPPPELTPDGDGPSHWRQQGFDPSTGFIWYNRESSDKLFFYDPNTGAWDKTAPMPAPGVATTGGVYSLGFHPNLFGPGRPGILILGFIRAYAWDIKEEGWSLLNATPFGGGTDLRDLSHGEGWYIPETDELLITGQSSSSPSGPRSCIAFAAGTGNETELSTANSASVRNKPPKKIASDPAANNLAACMHPRQPSVLLGMDKASNAVYYTDDAAVTAWKTASFTHPFATELNTTGLMSVGSLPYHGVVAGNAKGAGSNNTKFCFWKPPLV